MRRVSLLFALLTACTGGAPAGPLEPPPPTPRENDCSPADDAPIAETLQWKRFTAFQNDLFGALALDEATGCLEVDRVPCASIHRVSLGGQDVDGSAQYEPVASPLATTPLTIDRVVLNACVRRVDLDALGDPQVFTIDLAAPNASDVSDQITALYRRFLMRDPTPAEADVLAAMTPDMSARDWAVAACFAIGTTSENVLF